MGFVFNPCSVKLRSTLSLLGGLSAILVARLVIHPKYATDYESQAKWLKVLTYGLSANLIAIAGLIYICEKSQSTGVMLRRT
jgi:hypothetical protein